jgi:hypothetical protein
VSDVTTQSSFADEFSNLAQSPFLSGSLTSNIWNQRALVIAVCVSIVAAIKRLWLGLYLGRQTFVNYAEELAKVVKKMLIISEVASLG